MVPEKGDVIKLWQFAQKNKTVSVDSTPLANRSRHYNMPRDKSELEAES
jgi:hypothetical protein